MLSEAKHLNLRVFARNSVRAYHYAAPSPSAFDRLSAKE
jgi:hypothetical protein